jgi:hypothetical protein
VRPGVVLTAEAIKEAYPSHRACLGSQEDPGPAPAAGAERDVVSP